MVHITGNCVSKKEEQAYVDYLEKKHNRKLKTLDIYIDDEGFADLHFTFEQVPFERIRRITGYLVGDMSHWNDAKAAEEKDRKKHVDSGIGKWEQLD